MPRDIRPDSTLAPIRELPIIAHLATRWDPTWHRPHRFLRALAADAPVLIVEEPVVLDDVRRERLDVAEVAPNVWRALPRLPAYLRESERAMGTVRALLQAALRPEGALRGRFTAAVQWFQHSAPASEFLDALGESGVVLDCLGQQGDVTLGLDARARELLTRADLVLARGDQAGALEALRAGVVRIDDGVDAPAWCAPAGAEAAPADVASLPRPIYGYLGPVDDRLDRALLKALRARAAQGSVVLVGPPGRPPADGAIATPLPSGVQWLGARDEAKLPAYARAFDACIFPLVAGHPALVTEPPAVLECLAAGRAVVSSTRVALPDGMRELVQVAAEPSAFAAAAMSAAARGIAGVPVLDAALAEAVSWTEVARRVRGALFEAIAARPTPLAAIADAIIASRGIDARSPDAAP